MALESLHDLYVSQLQDLYSAETQILDALPLMIEASSHDELRQGFELHHRQTQEQARRLERILRALGEEPGAETCEGMKGLIAEGRKTMRQRADSDVLDAALIAAAQRIEHYEIAGYGCARTYAQALGRSDDASVLQQTLDEEAQTDATLTEVAESVVNPDAQRAGRSAERDVTRRAQQGDQQPPGRRPGSSPRDQSGRSPDAPPRS